MSLSGVLESRESAGFVKEFIGNGNVATDKYTSWSVYAQDMNMNVLASRGSDLYGINKSYIYGERTGDLQIRILSFSIHSP